MSGADPKYSCACGLSQHEKRRKWFADRCPLCHTKTKYPLVRQQGSFDAATVDRATSPHRAADLRGSGRSRSEERLHGCRVTDAGPPLYSRRVPQRDSSTEWLDPAELSISPPPPYNATRNPYALPSYEEVNGRHRPAAADQSCAAAAAAAPPAQLQSCSRRCDCAASELDQRQYEQLLQQYTDVGNRLCPCAKCHERFNELYRQMNDDCALPMATPMLMQDVLADGLAFCSLQ